MIIRNVAPDLWKDRLYTPKSPKGDFWAVVFLKLAPVRGLGGLLRIVI